MALSGESILVVGEDLGHARGEQALGHVAASPSRRPGFGDRRKDMLEDIAILTGGRVLSEELGVKLENIDPEPIGRAKRVVVDRDSTTIIGGTGDKVVIQARNRNFASSSRSSTSEISHEKLEERLAKLSGAPLRHPALGAASEAEMKSRKEALEDAIAATKAAVAEGIVPKVCAPPRDRRRDPGGGEGGGRRERTGLQIPSPRARRADPTDRGELRRRRRRRREPDAGDPPRCGPADVRRPVRSRTRPRSRRVLNAVSAASLLLLCEATLTEIPEPTACPRHGIGHVQAACCRDFCGAWQRKERGAEPNGHRLHGRSRHPDGSVPHSPWAASRIEESSDGAMPLSQELSIDLVSGAVCYVHRPTDRPARGGRVVKEPSSAPTRGRGSTPSHVLLAESQTATRPGSRRPA